MVVVAVAVGLGGGNGVVGPLWWIVVRSSTSLRSDIGLTCG